MRFTVLILAFIFPFSLLAQGTHVLEIDWITDFNSSEFVSIQDFAVDSKHNVYVAGNFEGDTRFDAGNVNDSISSFLYYDAFVAKLNPSGELLWIKHYHEIDTEIFINFQTASSIAIDKDDNVVIFGHFFDEINFNPDTDDDIETSSGSTDIYLLKLTATGEFMWINKLGSNGMDYATNIKIDHENNIYLTGGFNATVDFDLGASTSYLTAHNSISDIGESNDSFILKLDGEGNYQWVSHIANEFSSRISDIHIDEDQNVYIVGTLNDATSFISSEDLIVLSADNLSPEIFVAKINMDGGFAWAEKFGGALEDEGRSITTDPAGNVFFTGAFKGTVDFDPGEEVYNLTALGIGKEAFVSQLTPDGNFSWAKHIPSLIGTSISFDTDNTLWVLGSFLGTVDFDPGDEVHALTSSFHPNIFILHMDIDGGYRSVAKTDGLTGGPKLKIGGERYMYMSGFYKGDVSFQFDGELMSLSSPFEKVGAFIMRLGRGFSSVKENEAVKLNVFPNPTSDFVRITASQDVDLLVKIYDMHGKLLLQTSEMNIDIKGLAPGMYIANIENRKTSFEESVRFVVQ